MEKYIIEVPLSEQFFFMELLKRLPKIKFQIVEDDNILPEKQDVLDNLKYSLTEVQAHIIGERHLRDAYEFLSELKTELNYEQVSH